MEYGRVIKDKGDYILTHDALDDESIRQIQAIRKIVKAPSYEILLQKNDGYYPYCDVFNVMDCKSKYIKLFSLFDVKEEINKKYAK